MLFDKLASFFRASIADSEKVRLAQKEIESEDNVLVGQMLARRPKIDPSRMFWFSLQKSINLGTARVNVEIYNRGGRGLFITKMDGTPTTTLIRFNDKSGPAYEVRAGYIKNAFQKIYLTNAAEAGKTLKFLVGHRNFAEFMLFDPATQTTLALAYDELVKLNLKVKVTTLYLIAEKVMTLADTEYSFTLPTCKYFRLQTKDGTAFRWSFITGKVAGGGTESDPCVNILANQPYKSPPGMELTGRLIYFACGSAGKKLELQAWN